MQANTIKGDVLAGQPVAGAMIFEFFSPGMSAILANAGCRFVIYDMEHTGLGFETLKWLFASCRGLPIEPMVRVPRGEYTWLARALDLGARGVMIPMVESEEHARSIVQACRYPPLGRRGAAFGFAQCDYQGGDVGDKIRRYHERTLVIAQIETERGLEQVEQHRRGRRHRRALGRPLRPVQLHGHSGPLRRPAFRRGHAQGGRGWHAGTARRPASWPPTRHGSRAPVTWASR